MQRLSVRTRSAGNHLYHLEIYDGETHVGDYERSIRDEIPRKRKEIERSEDFLLDVYPKHCKFVVRWRRPEKEIRTYQTGLSDPGRGAQPVDVIPRRYWQA